MRTYHSIRVYKKNLHNTDVDAIQMAIKIFNEAKMYAYTLYLKKQRENAEFDESIHMMVKKRYELTDYVTTSATREAKGVFESQKELKKLYDTDTNLKIARKLKKLKTLEKRHSNYKVMLKTVIKGKFKGYKGCIESYDGDHDIFHIRHKKKKCSMLYFSYYDFEHMYLRKKIRKLRAVIGNIKHSIQILKSRKASRDQRMRGACFGSKKHMRAQFTKEDYQRDHSLWYEEFYERRNRSMRISGRYDGKFGNFVFKYDYIEQKLNILLPNDVTVQIDKINFPHGQSVVDDVYKNQLSKERRAPIAWAIEDKGEYYIFKISLQPISKEENINYNCTAGCLGVDLGYDHFAWSETDDCGNLIDRGYIHFSLREKTSGQAAKIMELKAIELINIASQKNKPLILEKLDLVKKKAQMQYQGKKSNHKVSVFAYKKMYSAIESRALKQQLGVFLVNPAYTSIIGKHKYMKQKGLSIHESAAYVIARRGQGMNDTLPKAYRTLLTDQVKRKVCIKHWIHINKLTKTLKKDFFYSLKTNQSFGSKKEFKQMLTKALV